MNLFPLVKHISDIQPHICGKDEIRLISQPNNVTIICYMFVDNKTFDSAQAMECRGIAFDQSGRVVSRPLHKFFNLNERGFLAEHLIAGDDIHAVFEKLDGSMIATAWIDGKLHWRSKKDFNSEVVKLTKKFLAKPENKHIEDFATEIAKHDYTAIFELTHPEARIVVEQSEPQLRLLHIRDNETGEYLMINPNHWIHEAIETYKIPVVPRYEMTMEELIKSLENMEGREGYVVQFKNGDMIKIKCDWYTRIHRSISYMRERDIARLALHGELDDVKANLVAAGADLTEVNEVETRLKSELVVIYNDVDKLYEADKGLSRKEYALKHQKNMCFGLLMSRYLGKEVNVVEWYEKNHLNDKYSLRSLGGLSEAAADAE
jgi:RNA ligase